MINVSGCYSVKKSRILINHDYENIDDLINTVYHELTHYYCTLHGIKDVKEGEYTYHTIQFKQAVEHHNGTCSYVNDKIGYNEAKLKEPAMRIVKGYLQELLAKEGIRWVI